jgi:hypothetical protein
MAWAGHRRPTLSAHRERTRNDREHGFAHFSRSIHARTAAALTHEGEEDGVGTALALLAEHGFGMGRARR